MGHSVYAIYKCKNCGTNHRQQIPVEFQLDNQTAVDMLSKIIGRSSAVPNRLIGEIPRYFICHCRGGEHGELGVAELAGLHY